MPQGRSTASLLRTAIVGGRGREVLVELTARPQNTGHIVPDREGGPHGGPSMFPIEMASQIGL